MTATVRFGPDDALRCRFAVSPLWETVGAVRALRDPRHRRQHLAWHASVQPLVPGLCLEELHALQPSSGYTPDFLAPAPTGRTATFADEIAAVRATDPGQVRREVRRSLASVSSGVPDPRAAAALLDDPAATRDRLADAIERAWRVLVAPSWPRLRQLLDDDIALRSQRLAVGGLEQMFAGLHPRVRWRAGLLSVVSRGVDEHRDLDGVGLVLMPSAFTWPAAVLVLDPPWQPTLVYAVHGIARLYERPAAPRSELSRLLGRTRAALLAGLDEPATPSSLAVRLRVGVPTVSEGLGVLRDAGLVTSSRRGRSVVYRRTGLGDALLRGASRGGEGRRR